MIEIDLDEYSLEDLHAHLDTVKDHIARREAIVNIPEEMRILATNLLEATGRNSGTEWVAPEAAFDAYPEGWEVLHDGKTWVSLIAGNVWEPGVSGWREVTTDDEIAAWVAPSGAHDAYQKGDKVSFQGVIYTSLIDGNTWSPLDYPAGWEAA